MTLFMFNYVVNEWLFWGDEEIKHAETNVKIQCKYYKFWQEKTRPFLSPYGVLTDSEGCPSKKKSCYKVAVSCGSAWLSNK